MFIKIKVTFYQRCCLFFLEGLQVALIYKLSLILIEKKIFHQYYFFTFQSLSNKNLNPLHDEPFL